MPELPAPPTDWVTELMPAGHLLEPEVWEPVRTGFMPLPRGQIVGRALDLRRRAPYVLMITGTDKLVPLRDYLRELAGALGDRPLQVRYLPRAPITAAVAQGLADALAVAELRLDRRDLVGPLPLGSQVSGYDEVARDRPVPPSWAYAFGFRSMGAGEDRSAHWCPRRRGAIRVGGLKSWERCIGFVRRTPAQRHGPS